MIKRRHVIYVHGYDPAGPAGYYRLFRRGWQKFTEVWPVKSTLGDLTIESDDIARWNVTTAGPNWSVETAYDLLRYDAALNANLSRPILVQVGRALRWLFDDLVTGTTTRIIRASWRFWAHLFVMQLGLVIWIGASLAAGWFAASEADPSGALPLAMTGFIGAGIAILIFVALRPVAERFLIIRINNCWPYLREFGRGDATCFDHAIAAGAERLRAAVNANHADEIILTGHSGGGPLAPAILARALELEPDLGRKGPRVVLLTLGSVMPAIALHPKAQRMRDIVRSIALEPSVPWIDCQSRKDPMNFWDFDPVEGIGLHIATARVNPLIWPVRFRDVLSPEDYKRIRAHFFRLHYQFIMGCGRRATYDYFMMVCGPLPVETWARRGQQALDEFAPDARYEAEADMARSR